MVASLNGHRQSIAVPGFVLPDHDVVLRDFSGEFAGVEIRVVRRMSVADAVHWYALSQEQDEPQVATALAQKMLTIQQHILSWNLVQRVKDEDGNERLEPIPITFENVMALPWDLASELRDKFDARLNEVAAPSGPLSSASTSGSQSAAQSETTEASSRSRRSSTRRNRKTA